MHTRKYLQIYILFFSTSHVKRHLFVTSWPLWINSELRIVNGSILCIMGTFTCITRNITLIKLDWLLPPLLGQRISTFITYSFLYNNCLFKDLFIIIHNDLIILITALFIHTENYYATQQAYHDCYSNIKTPWCWTNISCCWNYMDWCSLVDYNCSWRCMVYWGSPCCPSDCSFSDICLFGWSLYKGSLSYVLW